MPTNEADALKAAREWLSVQSPARYGIAFCEESLVALLLRQREEAVAAATPEIERRAKVEALEWVLEYPDLRPAVVEGINAEIVKAGGSKYLGWRPCSIPGYEQRHNEQGYLETRPIKAEIKRLTQ